MGNFMNNSSQNQVFKREKEKEMRNLRKEFSNFLENSLSLKNSLAFFSVGQKQAVVFDEIQPHHQKNLPWATLIGYAASSKQIQVHFNEKIFVCPILWNNTIVSLEIFFCGHIPLQIESCDQFFSVIEGHILQWSGALDELSESYHASSKENKTEEAS
jgi:hypothetical protein